MSLVYLHTLPPETAFETESGRAGVLLYANDCRARVRWTERRERTITTQRPGEEPVTRTFLASPEEMDIAPNTRVRATPKATKVGT